MSGCVVADLQCQVLWCLAPDIQIFSSSLSVFVVVVVVLEPGRGRDTWKLAAGGNRKMQRVHRGITNYNLVIWTFN